MLIFLKSVIMRRDKLQILIDILQICNGDGTNKTKIVYQSNINFRVADVYLDMLIKEGFIEAFGPGPRERYRTTEKGKEIRGYIKQVYDQLDLYPPE